MVTRVLSLTVLSALLILGPVVAAYSLCCAEARAHAIAPSSHTAAVGLGLAGYNPAELARIRSGSRASHR